VPDQRSNNATDFDSLQLFAERAKHSRHDFILDNNSIPAVTHICKLVEGMPLAIELAASWLRVLSISDIATEVEKGIGLLGSSARDLPSRHQSIRAVFDHSWQLLTQEEQVALRRLSVFQGGFRREAALEVADVSLPILASLTDKSLLTLTPSGRYRRHPLIIHYTQEKLAQVPEDKARAEENHGLYYLRFVQEKGKHLWGLQRKETLEAISEELTNVRAAWDWAVKVVRIEELKQSTFYLYDVYRILRPQEGLEVSGRAVEGLDENNPAHHAALGRLLVKHGTFQNDEGRHEEGGKAIRRGLDLLYRINDVDGILDGLGSLQRSARELGDYTESKKLGDEGLALARQYNKPGHISGWLVMLSNVVKDLEIMSLPEKFAFYEAGLKEVKALGDLYDLVGFIHLYAFFLLHHGQPQEAKRLQQDNLRLAREHSMVYEPGIIDCLAMAEYKLGNHQGAYALLQQAYTVGEKLKLAFFDGYVFGNLGKVARALGDHAKSKEYLKRSLEIGLETKSAFNMATTLVSFAELHMDQGQALQAAEWLSLSLHHPGTEMHGRIEAKRLLEQLHNQLPPKTLKAAIARGKTLDLSEVVRGILATL
jgi:tetratricopeptide (TPR) repeat protein